MKYDLGSQIIFLTRFRITTFPGPLEIIEMWWPVGPFLRIKAIIVEQLEWPRTWF